MQGLAPTFPQQSLIVACFCAGRQPAVLRDVPCDLPPGVPGPECHAGGGPVALRCLRVRSVRRTRLWRRRPSTVPSADCRLLLDCGDVGLHAPVALPWVINPAAKVRCYNT